jgi:hypothetical protein
VHASALKEGNIAFKTDNSRHIYGISGEKLPIIGEAMLNFQLGKKSYQFPFFFFLLLMIPSGYQKF